MTKPTPHQMLSPSESLFQSAARFHQQGDLASARSLYLQTVRRDPSRAEAWNNLGVILREQGKMIPALACFRQAVKHAGDGAPAAPTPAPNLAPSPMTTFRMNLGDLHWRLREPEEAKAHLHFVVDQDPNFTAAWLHLAQIYMTEGNFAEGHRFAAKALALDPKHIGPKWTRAFGFLMAGDYENGFPAWECRLELLEEQNPRPAIPIWKGEALNGKTLLLYGEQGLGDVLQFVRFIDGLPADIGRLIFETPLELRRLLEFSLHGKRPIEFRNHGSTNPVSADYQISLLSLPTRVASFPTAPYLFAPPGFQPIAKPTVGLIEGVAVGLCWAGNPTHRFDQDRSGTFQEFLKALALPGLELYSLQMGAAAKVADPVVLGPEGLVRDLSFQFKDFADTAGAIEELDCIVTVDTAIAHLAGAMGKRCHLLLPFHGLDWRWGLTGSTTRWYPSTTIHHRSEHDADWSKTLQAVAQDLLKS